MKYLIYAMCIAVAVTAKAQPGTLDNSFNKDGIVIGKGYTADVFATTLQKDGKIIVAGGGSYNDAGGGILARYNSDGSIDKSFGDKGIVITDFNGSIDNFYGVAVQEDGKVLAGGRLGKNIDAGVIRYLQDGTIDSSFGKNGIVLTDLGGADNVTGMVLQADGKIVLSGLLGSQVAFIIRYNDNGDLDESFGDKGIVLSGLGQGSKINCMAIQTDGKIIIGGVFYYLVAPQFLLIRYMPDGTIDQSFGVAGFVKKSFEGNNINLQLNSIALQQDNKVLIGGGTGEAYQAYAQLARFNNDGSVDKSFGNAGEVITKFGTDNLFTRSVLVQSDGKIVTVGYNNDIYQTYYHFLTGRYNTDGNLDSTFGTNGLQSTAVDQYSSAYAAALQPDGKIVAVGDNDKTTTIIRYNGGDLILPITYTKFTATQSQQYITLNWQTATELNNRYFAIERSSNGTSYSSIAQVNSIGTGATVHDYAYTDKLPVAGTNYYRLKQVDADGKYSYSKTVSINYLKPSSIQLFPNPAKDKLTVKGLNAAITSTISVLDVQGKTLLQFTVKAATYTFSIHNLAPGTYIVRIKDVNGVAAQKFVKQ